MLYFFFCANGELLVILLFHIIVFGILVVVVLYFSAECIGSNWLLNLVIEKLLAIGKCDMRTGYETVVR